MKNPKIANLVVVLLTFPLMVDAQSSASSISQGTERKGLLTGTVFDRNEAVIVGAKVLVRQGDTTLKVETSDEGTYRVELPEGTYNIEVDAYGFLPSKKVAHRVSVSSGQPLDFTLNALPYPVGVLNSGVSIS